MIFEQDKLKVIEMKNMFRKFVFTAFFLSVLSFIGSIAQEREGMTEYAPGFKFKDGVYLSFEQVKNNDPIPKAKILTSADYNDKEFFKDLMAADKIYFYDNLGVRQEIDKSNIWGYSRNGILYIQVQGNFNRITFVGSISHFVADILTYDSRYYNPYGYGGYYDPYYYRYPYYSPYSYYGNSYYPYGSYYSPYSRNMARSEIKQFIVDFDSGKVLDFDLDNTQLLLMKDARLYEEFVRLPRKKKKELMFVYIRKFNENNPLYLPVND